MMSCSFAAQHPFARHHVLRTAGGSPDCHFGLGDHCAALDEVRRYGEALRPGPTDQGTRLIEIGVANPSGLRNKEDHLIDLGPGIWSCAETHLSHVTQASCRRRLNLSACSHRDLRIHFGGAAPVRSNSDWAGTWTGVSTIGDFPSQELALPYGGERACGRLLTTRHYVHPVSILVSVIYGYARSPTWPRALEQTEQLAEFLTTHVVYGASGIRIICGDFNASETQLHAFEVWRRLGWKSAQSFAHEVWNQLPEWTCKAATSPDMVWLSPEALALCRAVRIQQTFAEHSTVSVSLQVPSVAQRLTTWPLPSRIPWEDVDDTLHQQSGMPRWNDSGTADQQWRQLGAALESSVDGCLTSQPHSKLHPHQRGRLQRCKPMTRSASQAILRPSRPSAVKFA